MTVSPGFCVHRPGTQVSNGAPGASTLPYGPAEAASGRRGRRDDGASRPADPRPSSACGVEWRRCTRGGRPPSAERRAIDRAIFMSYTDHGFACSIWRGGLLWYALVQYIRELPPVWRRAQARRQSPPHPTISPPDLSIPVWMLLASWSCLVSLRPRGIRDVQSDLAATRSCHQALPSVWRPDLRATESLSMATLFPQRADGFCPWRLDVEHSPLPAPPARLLCAPKHVDHERLSFYRAWPGPRAETPDWHGFARVPSPRDCRGRRLSPRLVRFVRLGCAVTPYHVDHGGRRRLYR